MLQNAMSATFPSPTAAISRHAERAPAGYVPEIDAVRALAIGAVMLVHAGFLPFGWAGVWLFFVVSGFAVTTSLIRSEIGSKFQRLRHFYVRRFLRIGPLYLFFIGLNTLFLLNVSRFAPLRAIPFLLTFTYNFRYGFDETEYGPGAWSPFGTMWSLSVEEQFYLLFPLVFLFVSRRRLVGLLCGLILSDLIMRWGLATWAEVLNWSDFRANRLVYAFGPAHFDAFAAGALVALFRTKIERAPVTVNRFVTAAVLGASAYIGTIVTMQAMRFGFNRAFHNVIAGELVGNLKEVFVYPVMWGVSAALLMLILVRQKRIIWLCHIPGLQALGRVSYGVYIFHIPVFMVVRDMVLGAGADSLPLPLYRGVVLVVAAPLSFGLAWLSFQYMEQPILRLRSRFD
jgi:peptidoglycan/LPS O-acetylase OafA/YrhL